MIYSLGDVQKYKKSLSIQEYNKISTIEAWVEKQASQAISDRSAKIAQFVNSRLPQWLLEIFNFLGIRKFSDEVLLLREECKGWQVIQQNALQKAIELWRTSPKDI